MPGKTSERERHSGVMFEGGRRARGSSNVTGGGGGGGGCERLAIRSIESTARNCFRRRKKDAATRRKFFSRRKIRGGGGDGRKYWIKGELCGIARARGLDRNNVIILETSDACFDRSPGSSRLKDDPLAAASDGFGRTRSASAPETFVRRGDLARTACTSAPPRLSEFI